MVQQVGDGLCDYDGVAVVFTYFEHRKQSTDESAAHDGLEAKSPNSFEGIFVTYCSFVT